MQVLWIWTRNNNLQLREHSRAIVVSKTQGFIFLTMQVGGKSNHSEILLLSKSWQNISLHKFLSNAKQHLYEYEFSK